MTPQEYDRLARLIADPPPGSKLAAAQEQGVDLRILLENLKLTPTERLEKAFRAQAMMREFRRAMSYLTDPEDS